jgi:uracil-DNA glycosylase family 4
VTTEDMFQGVAVESLRRHPWAQCEACPLFDPRNKYVPTLFPAGKPTLAVVGEAPGFQEAAYGKPFMGPSGQLIKKVLSRYGYSRDEVVFTNACLCRPPDNATPPKTAVNACRPRLIREIAASGAKDILALGGTAADALVDSGLSITRLRVGPPKPPTSSFNAFPESSVERVVPTWHPAYCLRTADAFPALVNDVGKLREKPREPWVEPHLTIVDTRADALRAIEDLHVRTDTLVVDIEVGFEKDEAFFHPNEFGLLCVGLAYAKRRAVVIGESALADGEVRAALRGLLLSKKLAAHNGKFDLAGLQPVFGTLTLFFDTMLASYVLDERPGQHGLEVVAIEKLGSPSWKQDIKQYLDKSKNYANIPRAILYHYNGLDVCNTWDIKELFEEKLNAPVRYWPYDPNEFPVKNLRDVHDFLVRASDQLMFPEMNGIAVDLPYNQKLGVEYEGRIAEIEAKINEVVNAATKGSISSINPRSPIQIKKFLATQGILVASTNVATLNALQSRVAARSYAGQFVSQLLRHRREQKLYSTYVIGLRKRLYRGRVYTTYLLHGTTSGRLASRNPNLQNIVRDKTIKRQYVASKPNNVLIQCDYKQAELRVMTTLAKDEYFRQILSDPKADLFTELVCQLYGVTKEKALDGSAVAKEMRIRIKAFVYGLSYGREAGSIATEFGIPRREAEQLRSQFFSLIPNIAAWQKWVIAEVHKRQELITPFGRHRRFHLITNQNRKDVENEALSFLPQSTASDICLGAFVRVRPLLRGLAYVRLTIHDALIVECAETRADEVALLLSETMAEQGRLFSDYVPFPVDVSIGKSWGDL